MHSSVWVEAGPSDLHGEPRSWLVAGLAGPVDGSRDILSLRSRYEPVLVRGVPLPVSVAHRALREMRGSSARTVGRRSRPARAGAVGVWPRSPGTESLHCPGP